MKYKSKLKRNSKYNPKSERFLRHAMLANPASVETCKGKIAHQTINNARQAKKAVEGRGQNVGIYKCPHCKKYHLTSI